MPSQCTIIVVRLCKHMIVWDLHIFYIHICYTYKNIKTNLCEHLFE